MQKRRFLISILVIGLQGCVAPSATPDLAALNEPKLHYTTGIAPPGAKPGTCWGRSASPAVIETVTEQILLQPAEVLADGTVVQPAVYKTETLQKIVKERRETWFQTPCAEDLTVEFLSSLQRALKARDLYRGPITGELDARTRSAIRKYQEPQGLDSGILALETGRQLGLIAIARDVD